MLENDRLQMYLFISNKCLKLRSTGHCSSNQMLLTKGILYTFVVVVVSDDSIWGLNNNMPRISSGYPALLNLTKEIQLSGHTKLVINLVN